MAVQGLIRVLEAVNEGVGRLVSWLTLAMVFTTFAIVVLRYGFDLGWIALQESVTYMHALVFMLGAAYTLRHDEHVRVDIVNRRLPPRGRAALEIAGHLVLLLPMAVAILWMSWEFVASSWRLQEGSPDAGGLPFVYLLKSVLILMPALLILQSVAGILRAGLTLGRADGEEG